MNSFWGEKKGAVITASFLPFQPRMLYLTDSTLNISKRWRSHLADCSFKLSHWLKSTESPSRLHFHISSSICSPQTCDVGWGEKRQIREKKWYTEGSVTVTVDFFFLKLTPILLFFCFILFCIFNPLKPFNWERHGGQTQTFSVPGPASSSAAVRAPLCLEHWAESVSGIKHCERWQKAAGPESAERKKKEREWLYKKI